MLSFSVAQGSKDILLSPHIPTTYFKYKKWSLMTVYFVLFIPVYLCVDDRRNTTLISSAFFIDSWSDNFLLSSLT